MSKALTNRLKGFIGETISLNQSAFVLGRLIGDNIMVHHEYLSFFE